MFSYSTYNYMMSLNMPSKTTSRQEVPCTGIRNMFLGVFFNSRLDYVIEFNAVLKGDRQWFVKPLRRIWGKNWRPVEIGKSIGFLQFELQQLKFSPII